MSEDLERQRLIDATIIESFGGPPAAETLAAMQVGQDAREKLKRKSPATPKGGDATPIPGGRK